MSLIACRLSNLCGAVLTIINSRTFLFLSPKSLKSISGKEVSLTVYSCSEWTVVVVVVPVVVIVVNASAAVIVVVVKPFRLASARLVSCGQLLQSSK